MMNVMLEIQERIEKLDKLLIHNPQTRKEVNELKSLIQMQTEEPVNENEWNRGGKPFIT